MVHKPPLPDIVLKPNKCCEDFQYFANQTSYLKVKPNRVFLGGWKLIQDQLVSNRSYYERFDYVRFFQSPLIQKIEHVVFCWNLKRGNCHHLVRWQMPRAKEQRWASNWRRVFFYQMYKFMYTQFKKSYVVPNLKYIKSYSSNRKTSAHFLTFVLR